MPMDMQEELRIESEKAIAAEAALAQLDPPWDPSVGPPPWESSLGTPPWGLLPAQAALAQCVREYAKERAQKVRIEP